MLFWISKKNKNAQKGYHNTIYHHKIMIYESIVNVLSVFTVMIFLHQQ